MNQMNALHPQVGGVGVAIAGNQAAAPNFGGLGVAGQAYPGFGAAQAIMPRTLVDEIMEIRKRGQARDQVLEYIQAQLNMTLFQGVAAEQFESAMRAAIQHLKGIV